uniref:Progonadoliberin n=1 Tax=Trichopodus trichopterus TaxID=96903 RepID=T2C5Y4_TRITC|nr:gonadotropin releasing hormone 1 [Trichopodus trichopterus]
MAVKLLALLLLGTLVPQHFCQHWSYGLSPGGKRGLDSISDTLDNMVEEFPRVDTPCSVVSCAESPSAKIYRMKAFFDTDRGNGRRTYKKR